MKNMKNTIGYNLMSMINDLASNIAKNSIGTCGLIGGYEVEIPMELINEYNDKE